MNAIMDEFEIKATAGNESRIWTRDDFQTAKHIADQAFERLYYDHVEVVNTFGGHRSDPLYIRDKEEANR
jgi:hypothetical protein